MYLHDLLTDTKINEQSLDTKIIDINIDTKNIEIMNTESLYNEIIIEELNLDFLLIDINGQNLEDFDESNLDVFGISIIETNTNQLSLTFDNSIPANNNLINKASKKILDLNYIVYNNGIYFDEEEDYETLRPKYPLMHDIILNLKNNIIYLTNTNINSNSLFIKLINIRKLNNFLNLYFFYNYKPTNKTITYSNLY
jgi:hypothetical protein